MTTLPPICLACTHFGREADTLSCTAFPDGIPEDILASEFDHRKPHEGDHGIQFEMAPDGDSAILELLKFPFEE